MEFLNWFKGIDMPIDTDWLLVRDFNLIRWHPDQNKLGGNINKMLGFNDAISNLKLEELKQMALLKLDIEKTFDKVEHEVILQVLNQKGFPDKWVQWIHGILNSGTSVFLNGTPGKVFHCKREVWQGDPLSPLIFVLATDLLQSILNKAKDNDLLKLPLNVGYTNDFPIIQYVDDTLLIIEACP
jgi:hypothetical protein